MILKVCYLINIFTFIIQQPSYCLIYIEFSLLSERFLVDGILLSSINRLILKTRFYFTLNMI